MESKQRDRTCARIREHIEMHMTINMNRLSAVLATTAALAFLAATPAAMQGQETSGAAQPLAPISLKSTLIAPLDMSSSSSNADDLNYLSNVGAVETAKAEGFSFGAREGQPPPRRRYGRPNYSDSHTNADGSAKYSFFAGGGFTVPVSKTHAYATPGWKIQAGGGRNFNQAVGVMVEFDYDKFGMQKSTLTNQINLYNNLCIQNSGQSCLDQLGGNIHDWSFSLNPVVNFYASDTVGAYVTGGPGFYHKYTQFTTPAIGTYCDPYYGCYQYQANQPVDWYTSNAFGLNIGAGLTYKLSRWANQRFYMEARYVWTDNKQRPYDVSGTTNYFNAFPQASERTTWIPVTFGIRF